jgi:carboxymethylenebutenolidase
MASYWDSTKVDGADMRLYVSVPDGTGPFPAVVVIQHQGGVDEFMEEMTQRIASAGYLGVAPDLYHRDAPDCRDDAPTRRARLRDVTVIKDVNVTVDFLTGHRLVESDRLGIIGFCMGGRVSYLMAAAHPGFKAAVSYYGGASWFPGARALRPSSARQRSTAPCWACLGRMTPTRHPLICANSTLN